MPSVKNFSLTIDQSTMSSPKTIFSRIANREVDSSSITSRSMLSRKSKYSQSSVLQKSSLFSNMLHPINRVKEEKKCIDIQEESEHLRLTI
jgi:hypothetical protein